MNKKILLAVGLIVAGALVLQARSFSVANNIPSGEYFKIKPKGSYLCLSVQNDRRGNKLVLGSCSRDGAKWKFYKSGNGIYRIRSKVGGYLGFRNNRKKKSDAFSLNRYAKVKLLAKSGNTFHMKISDSGSVLDAAGDIRRRGTRVTQHPFHGGNNQQWQLKFADTGRTFNYRTYRPARDTRRNNSAGSNINLQTSMQRGDYAVERYFKACTSSQLRTDNEGDFLGSYFSSQKLAKRLTVAMKVISGARQNPSSQVRSMVYRGLLNVDFAGGGFVEKLAKGAVRKEINKAIRVETMSYSNKQYLNKLMQKMR